MLAFAQELVAASAISCQQATQNYEVNSQFLPLSDSFHPEGYPVKRSLDTTWRVATEKFVTGVPSGA